MRISPLLIFIGILAARASLLALLQIIPPGPPFEFAPKPVKPPAARHATGAGIFLLRVDVNSGRVKQVIIRQSTGDQRLDDSAVKALNQWRVHPGALKAGMLYRHGSSMRLDPSLGPQEASAEVPITFLP